MTIVPSLQCLQQKVSWETLDSKLCKKEKEMRDNRLTKSRNDNPSENVWNEC